MVFAYLSYSASNVIIILIIVFLIYDYYSRIISIKNLFKKYIIVIIRFYYNHFSLVGYKLSIFWLNFIFTSKFLPLYRTSFSNMMHETSPPSISEYLDLNFNLILINNYFTWFIKDIFSK